MKVRERIRSQSWGLGLTPWVRVELLRTELMLKLGIRVIRLRSESGTEGSMCPRW